jgi:acetyl esterase
MIDPHFAAMIEAEAKALEGQPQPAFEDVPLEMLRGGYQMQRVGQNQLTAPKDVAVRDFKADGVPVRLYTPKGAAATSGCLVYFHGGGFVIGDLETHDGHCRRLADGAGVRVVAVDYRLAPEHPFPASHDDALAATRWVFDHASEIGVDPRRIAVGGCSAGGNLAASVALDLKDDAKRKLAFQLLLYPVIWPVEPTASARQIDGPILSQAVMVWFAKCLAANGHAQAHRARLGLAKSVAGAAPALIVTAGNDLLKDEGRDYAARLNAAGVAAAHVEYPTLVHDFYVMGDVSPAVIEATRETTQALKAALA